MLRRDLLASLEDFRSTRLVDAWLSTYSLPSGHSPDQPSKRSAVDSKPTRLESEESVKFLNATEDTSREGKQEVLC